MGRAGSGVAQAPRTATSSKREARTEVGSASERFRLRLVSGRRGHAPVARPKPAAVNLCFATSSDDALQTLAEALPPRRDALICACFEP
jgi:hypothetical protein